MSFWNIFNNGNCSNSCGYNTNSCGCRYARTCFPIVETVYTQPTSYATEVCDENGYCTFNPIYKISNSCLQYGIFDGSITSLAAGAYDVFTTQSSNGCDVCLNSGNISLAAGHTYNVSYSANVSVAEPGPVVLSVVSNGTVIGQLVADLATANQPQTLTWSGLVTTQESTCSNWCACCCATSLQVRNDSTTAVTLADSTLSAYRLA